MERWIGIVKVPVESKTKSCYRVGASLCLSSNTLTVPCANAIFFTGDRVEGTGNPVIERLSDLQKIAEILVSKFATCVNAWVIEASSFNGPFAVYKDFIPSVNETGEPKLYSPIGFPASTTTVSLLSTCLQEANNILSTRQREPCPATTPASCFYPRNTFILGFSKGGTVLNQLVSELAFIQAQPSPPSESHINQNSTIQIIPTTKESLLNTITEIHYIDVGLNSPGAYITDPHVIETISKRLMVEGSKPIRFVLHGTPRQWCDSRRVWIRNEKDKLVHLLESEARKSGGGRLQVCERFYFGDRLANMQMHFEIIQSMDLS